MSWSIGMVITNKEGFADVSKNLEELQKIERPSVSANVATEQEEQIQTAIKTASILLTTEVFQHATQVQVLMSGHANPEHKASDTSSNESIGLRIDVKQYRRVDS